MTDPVAPAVRPLPPGARARLVAIVRASRLDAVMEALHPLAPGDVLIEPVRGYNRQKTHLGEYEEVGLLGGFLPKVRLQFVVEGAAADSDEGDRGERRALGILARGGRSRAGIGCMGSVVEAARNGR